MLEEKSFLDMLPTSSVGNASYRDIQKTLRGDVRLDTICFECKKHFSRNLPAAPGWPYKEGSKDKLKYFCSWNCLSRYRKKRGL